MKYTTIGESCSVVSGGTPSRSKNEYWKNGNIPWLKIGNLKSKYVKEYDEQITELGLKNSSAKMLSKGTILYTIFATLGEVGILDIEACTNQAIAGISIIDSRITTDYLYYYLKSKKEYVNNIGRGVAQNNINLSTLKKFEIPLISIEKQHDLVNILDKIENLIDEKKKIIDDYDLLIKARFIEMFGNLAINEKCWKIQDLESVATIVTYGLTVRPEYIDKGIDLVSARELHKGYVAYDEAPKISEEDFNKLSEKGKPKKYDILFSKTGSIGLCALVEDDRKFAITQNAARIGLKLDLINPTWLLYYLRMDFIQNWCKSHAKGNAVKDFQLKDMKMIPLFDCPLELQNQFASLVEQIDKSKLVLEKRLQDLEILKKSLMQQYFG